MNSDFKTLISKDSKGKIRVVEISYEGNEATRIYTIYRYTGQFEGKMTKQPEIIVDKGKATRNIHEQVELQFNALVKSYINYLGNLLLDQMELSSQCYLNRLIK